MLKTRPIQKRLNMRQTARMGSIHNNKPFYAFKIDILGIDIIKKRVDDFMHKGLYDFFL